MKCLRQSYQLLPGSNQPCYLFHIDHFFVENKVCLLVIDSLSKYIECEIVSDTSAEKTMDALRLIFSRNGLTDQICSDNATSFTACQFQSFQKANGIKHISRPLIPHRVMARSSQEVWSERHA